MGRGAALGVIAALTAALTGCSADSPPSAASPSPSAVPDHDVQLQVQTAEVSGRRVAWARLGAGGAGSGDPLVLLNGTGSPMAEWDPMLLAELSRGRQVIVYDYPGLGGSQRLRGRLTFDRLADSLHGLLGALGLSQVDVLGWSMGTFVAQRLVVRHPQDVGHLILVGGNPGGSRTTLGPRWVQRADSDPDAGTDTYLRTNYPRIPCAQAAGRRFLERLSRGSRLRALPA
ncbi:MAG: alpha/beta fold hydrolase [Candidatus Nanopelagicales bacterium]